MNPDLFPALLAIGGLAGSVGCIAYASWELIRERKARKKKPLLGVVPPPEDDNDEF